MTRPISASSTFGVDLRDDRGTLNVCTFGDASAPPLLLLHGGGLNARSWQPICATLVADYFCIAPDLLGHGDSTWSHDGHYSIIRYAEDVHDLVSALDLPPLPVVGHSLGGLAATAYTASSAHPTALVLVDVGLEPRQEGAHAVVEFMKDTSGPYESLDELIEHALRFNPRRDREVLRSTLAENMQRLDDGRWRWKYDQRFFPGSVGRIDTERLELQLAATLVRCPVLIIRGAESTVLSAANAETTAGRFDEARIATVAASGHTPHGDNPNGFLDALIPFLREVRS